MVTLNAGLSVVSSVNFKIFQPIVKEIPSYVKDTHDFIKKFYQKVKDTLREFSSYKRSK